MSRRSIVLQCIATTLILLVWTILPAFAQRFTNQAHVYKLQITMPNSNKYRIQTGFRLKGYKGIITALHGVAGASAINARNQQNDIIDSLSIYLIDVSNDLALLSHAGSERLIDRGFESASLPTVFSISSQAELYTLGFPHGMELYRKPVRASTPVIRKLSDLIPTSSIETVRQFVRRKSPSVDASVISLDGNLVKGHSGSPVLNLQNHVVGVVNGGIAGGAAGISWAIPISNLRLTNDRLSQVQLNDLASENSNELFESVEEPIVTATAPKMDVQYITVSERSSLAVLNGQVIISLQDVNSGIVRASVGSTSGANSMLQGQVGTTLTYKTASGVYVIRVISSTYTSATFSVTSGATLSTTNRLNNSTSSIEQETISTGDTITMFNERLYVTLEKIDHDYRDPYKAHLIFGTRLHKNKKLKGYSGYAEQLKLGSDIYEVRIMNITFSNVRIKLERLK